jgi:methylthioribose-1-phosphate isomerase
MALNGVVGAFSIVLWAIINNIRTKADKTAEDFAAYKVHVAETYASSVELREALAAINRSFENYSNKLDTQLARIELKIDQKADKKDS